VDTADRRQILLERLRTGSLKLAGGPLEIPRLATGALQSLSRAQKRILFVQELYPQGCFNGSLVLRYDGALDVSRLEAALSAVLARHDVLRTNAVLTSRGAFGRVNLPELVSCPVIDLRQAPASIRREQAIARGREIANGPFDLYRDKALLRAALILLDDAEAHLVLAMHMFAFDAPSGILFARDLASAYAGAPAGQPAAYQYADYVAWAAEQNEPPRTGLDHWVQRLAGAAQDQQLPTDRARSEEPTFAALRHPFVIDRALEVGLKALGRKQAATFYMVMLAALKVVLQRHAGENNISVGAWTVMRDARTAELVGPFVNTLVYRTEFGSDDSFLEVLAKVKQQALAAYAHAAVPFEDVVAAVNPHRDPRLNPLFQVHFILQETGTTRSLNGFTLSELDAVIGASGGYDIELIIRDLPRGVEGHFECSADLFDARTGDRLAERFLQVLQAIVRDPGQRVSSLSFEDAPWTPEMSAPPAPSLEAQVELIRQVDSNCIAIIEGEREITYGALLADAGLIEAELRRAPAGSVLGLTLGGGAELCAAMIAALHCGIPFISLGREPDLFTAVQRKVRLVPLPDRPVKIDPLEAAPAEASNRPAFLALTSGSTGEPALVEIERGALANLIAQVTEAYALGPESRVLQATNPRFDVVVEEVLPTLCAGGRLIVSDPLTDGLDSLDARCRGHGVTHMNLSASLWASWFAHLKRSALPPPSQLRVLVVGSEPVNLDAAIAWRELFGDGVRLLNAYGVAEAAVTAAVYEIPGVTALRRLPRTPIGKPLRGVALTVADSAGRDLPAGVVGELWVGGAGVATAYVGNPGAARSPFVTRSGRKWFRTGDLGRRRDDGDYEVLGRLDRKLKVRGRLVDPEALEASILTVEGVAAATAQAIDSGGAARMVVTAWPRLDQSAGAADLEALRKRIADRLRTLGDTPYDQLIVVGSPVTSTPAGAATADAGSQHLAALWRDVAGVPIGSAEDNLFDLGVTSMDCLNVVAAARDAGLFLSVADVYASPTVAGQVARLNAAGRAGVPPAQTGDPR
jgi:non-ribosomal peptide synthetase component F